MSGNISNSHHTKVHTQSVAFSSGTTSAATTTLKGNTVVGLIIPSDFTGTEVYFQVSVDGSTFYNLIDSDGFNRTYTVAASRYLHLEPNVFAGVLYIKVVSNATEGTNTVDIVLRDID